MNKKDMKIIAHLRQDARMPLTVMSKKIQVPVSTIFDRLKNGEETFITKHTSLLDFVKLGYNTRANIVFRVERDCKDQFRDYLLKHQSVNSVYRINNGFDFMIEGVFKQVKDMEDFMETVENKFKVIDKKSFFVIEDLKREEFMADPELVFVD